MKPSRPRGSAMLMAMSVVLGLLLLSAGVLAFSSHHTAETVAMRQREQMANCALAVRQYLGSQLRFPSSPSLASLTFTIPGATAKDGVLLQGGHYGAASVTNFQVTGSKTGGGVAPTVEDMANNVRANPSGSSMTGVATCTDNATKAQYEVEFSYAFGI